MVCISNMSKCSKILKMTKCVCHFDIFVEINMMEPCTVQQFHSCNTLFKNVSFLKISTLVIMTFFWKFYAKLQPYQDITFRFMFQPLEILFCQIKILIVLDFDSIDNGTNESISACKKKYGKKYTDFHTQKSLL